MGPNFAYPSNTIKIFGAHAPILANRKFKHLSHCVVGMADFPIFTRK